MGKTPDYTLKAIENYRKNKDRVTLFLPQGLKKECETVTGEKFGVYVQDLIKKDLEHRKNTVNP